MVTPPPDRNDRSAIGSLASRLGGGVKYLDSPAKKAISEAIARAERQTSGEIRVHVVRRLRGNDALSEAKKIFIRLEMQRTRHRNAVLIYVAPESRQTAIVGDSGIHSKVGEDYWKSTRDILTSHFSKGLFEDGIVAAVASVGEKLKTHFPPEKSRSNELPNNVTGD